MATKNKASKAAVIREYIEQFPESSAAKTVEALNRNGVNIKPSDVYFQRSAMKAKRKGKRSKSPATNRGPFEDSFGSVPIGGRIRLRGETPSRAFESNGQITGTIISHPPETEYVQIHPVEPVVRLARLSREFGGFKLLKKVVDALAE